MRLIFVLATSSLAAGQAMAQETADWAGAYGGVEVGASGLTKTQTVVDIEPGRWPGATYPTGVLSGTTFEPEIGSASKGAMGAFMGMTFDTFGLVSGGEVNVLISPIERVYKLGPVRGIRTGDPRAVTFLLPSSFGAPSGARGTVLTEDDTITSTLTMNYNLSLRGRVGVPIADLALVSAYAGVAMTSAELHVAQHSAQTGAYFFRATPSSPEQSIPLNNAADVETVRQQTLVGPTFGALAEYRLPDTWLGRLDLAYTMFDEISVTNTVGSTVAIEPTTWSVTTGFSRKF